MIKLIISAIIFISPLFAKTVAVSNLAKVSFNTTASPGGVHIMGEADNSKEQKSIIGSYELNPNDLTGHFELVMQNLDTGIRLRTKHMKETYLQVDKFPTCVLDISKTKYTPLQEASFTGTILLHGQKKPIVGTLLLKENTLKLDFYVKLTDFNIEIPNFLGITMKEDIHVLAETTETP